MSSAGNFPLYHPASVRRPFSSAQTLRRMVKVAQLKQGSRVLDWGGGEASAGLLLAKDLGCTVVALDTDDTTLVSLQARVLSLGLEDKIQVRCPDWEALAQEPPFHLILAQGRGVLPFDGAAERLRPLLAANGRLVMTYPSKVGRSLSPASQGYWSAQLGEAPRLPRELLQSLEQRGFEPEAVETLSDAELDAYYRELEGQLGQASEQEQLLRQEIALSREQSGKASVSYALALARRREPGEPLPSTNDRG